MADNVYTVNKINDTTYQIDEMGRDFCYLLLGEEKALLIDCSIGTDDLKKVVKEITSLPLTVAATHGHTDHTGGAWQFKKIYIPKPDCKPALKIYATRNYREKLLSNRMRKNGISKKDIKGHLYDCKWIAFEDGKGFDLGNRTVKAVFTPGHSVGSCIFLDEKEKMMFTGDNTLSYLLITVKPCTTLETWLCGAEKTLALSKEYEPWSAHGEGKQTSEQISHTISLVRQIMEKYPQNTKEKKQSDIRKRLIPTASFLTLQEYTNKQRAVLHMKSTAQSFFNSFRFSLQNKTAFLSKRDTF